MNNNLEIKRTPITTPHSAVKRLVKNTSFQSIRLLKNIRLNIEINRYKPVLVFLKERRDFVPILVEVCEFYNHFFVVRHKCYNPDGEFRQYLYFSVSYTDLMTGESKIQFFEDDI